MKTIRFLSFAITLLIVNIAFAADEIHWTVTGKDSVAFDWRGTSAENSIGYGTTSGNYTQVIATTPNPVPVSSSVPFWEARLTGLQENTRYYYQIGTGPERSFRTPPAPGSSDFTVYAEGNIGSTSAYFNTGGVQDIIANDLPSFVVGLGDLTLGSTASSISTCTQTALNVSGASVDGYSYRIKQSFGTPADNTNFPTQSTLRLFENGVEMGPAHSRDSDIRTLGAGRFRHWSNTDGTVESIRFSASNNTDPRTNGKRYSYCLTATRISPIDQHFNDVMVWSKEAAYMPVWGDMDTVTSTNESFKNYKGRFAVPNPQTSPGSSLAGGEDWYWFDYGNVRFITLPEPWTGAWADWNTKASALMAQAQNDPNIKFIVTFVHRPAYSSGHYTGSSTLKGMLDALGDTYSKYQLNINAHSNNYERSFPQHGVTHITAGTGGADLTQDGTCLWLTCTKPSWSAFRAMHLGALKLHFTASSIEGSFICGPAGGGINDVTCATGSVPDSFTIRSPSTLVCAQGQTALDVAGASVDGYSYRIKQSFGTPADNTNFPTQSTLRLFENGLEMGPAHSRDADIRTLGAGRFRHWSNTDGTVESIRFSASNNTDPQTNGKNYCVSTAQAPTNVTSNPPPPVTGGTSNPPPPVTSGTIPLITDSLAVFTEPTLSRPAYLSSISDPTFKTKITRIGGNAGTGFSFSQGGSGTWDSYVRHAYSKDQPWNADQSLLMIYNSGSQIFLDGSTYLPKFSAAAKGYSRGDDRWHPTLPNIKINAGFSNILEWFDVVNGVQARKWVLPFNLDWGIGQGEGNASSDGRYIALADATRMFIVDMDPQAPFASYASGNRRIGPARDISDGGVADWVSVSASGKYAVVMYKLSPSRPRVFDINPTTLALTPRSLPGASLYGEGDHAQGWMPAMGHADLTMNPFDNNEDVIIGQRQKNGPPVGSVMMMRLKDGAISGLTLGGTGSTATMTHVSARNVQRPGWVCISYLAPENYIYDPVGLRYSDELVMLKLDGSGSIERLAHAHSLSAGNYNAEQHAVVSPDGKRVLWASNWMLKGTGSPGNNDIKPYVVDTRP